MKKITLVFALALLLFAGSSYAAPVTTGPRVPASVTKEFGQHFTGATEVKWENVKDYFKATFAINGKMLYAFYTQEGDLMGTAHNLSPLNLPQPLRNEIKTSYAGYWITDLFSYRTTEGHGLVITLENSDKVVILATNDEGWSVYKTTPKK